MRGVVADEKHGDELVVSVAPFGDIVLPTGKHTWPIAQLVGGIAERNTANAVASVPPTRMDLTVAHGERRRPTCANSCMRIGAYRA